MTRRITLKKPVRNLLIQGKWVKDMGRGQDSTFKVKDDKRFQLAFGVICAQSGPHGQGTYTHNYVWMQEGIAIHCALLLVVNLGEYRVHFWAPNIEYIF